MTHITGFAPRTLRTWWPWALHHGVHPIVLAALYDCESCFEDSEPDSWTEVSNSFYQFPSDLFLALSSGGSISQSRLLFPYVEAAQKIDAQVKPADVLEGRIEAMPGIDERQGLYFAGRIAYALRKGRGKGRSLRLPVERALNFFARSFPGDDDVYLYFSAMLIPVVGYDSAKEVEEIERIENAPPPPKVVPGVSSDGSLSLKAVLDLLKNA